MKSEDLDHRGNPRFAFAGDLRELRERVEALERREGENGNVYTALLQWADLAQAREQAFKELAEEFRRLADGARAWSDACGFDLNTLAKMHLAKARTWDEAAQMVDFIAHAREDIPFLLAEIKRLEAEKAETIEVLEGLVHLNPMNKCGNCMLCGTDLEWGPEHAEDCPYWKSLSLLDKLKGTQ